MVEKTPSENMMDAIIEAADGMKRDLEQRGWSPTAAEQVAMSWLSAAMVRIWQQ